ncbi:MAG: lipocalin family protein [Flavobacteriaceae bacterium]|nr:lipocalin family protein [Flavobacteriaceae bacterium]
MKSKLILLLTVLTLISCSKSEETVDEIVGLWKLKSIKVSGQERINSCKLKDNVDIRSNNTFTIFIHQDSFSCTEQSSTGTWSKISDGKYEFKAAGDTRTFTLTNKVLSFSVSAGTSTYVHSYSKE